jgi:hypothetical protein
MHYSDRVIAVLAVKAAHMSNLSAEIDKYKFILKITIGISLEICLSGCFICPLVDGRFALILNDALAMPIKTPKTSFSSQPTNITVHL